MDCIIKKSFPAWLFSPSCWHPATTFVCWEQRFHLISVSMTRFQHQFSGFYWLRQLRRIARSLDVDLTITLVHLFALSRVDCCNTLLAGALKAVTDKLQRMLNAAARVVSGTHKYEPGLSRLLHSQLHCLNVPERVMHMYKHGVVYGCLHHSTRWTSVHQCLMSHQGSIFHLLLHHWPTTIFKLQLDAILIWQLKFKSLEKWKWEGKKYLFHQQTYFRLHEALQSDQPVHVLALSVSYQAPSHMLSSESNQKQMRNNSGTSHKHNCLW